MGGTTQRGRIRVNTAKATDMDAINYLTDKIVEAKVNLNALKEKCDGAKVTKNQSDIAFNEWNIKYAHTTKDALLNCAKSVGAPVIAYYHKLFNTEGGDCYNIRQMVDAAKIFNPIFLTGHSDAEIINIIYPLADKLSYFGYNMFTEEFIAQLKKEMTKVVAEADLDHNLHGISTSKTYKTRMQKRVKRKKLEHNIELDWRKDDGEYACRIWEWWSPRVKDFPVFAVALRLVVLTQLSSCSVERVFSRLSVIEDVCGGGMLEDALEMRLFLQCNGDLNEIV